MVAQPVERPAELLIGRPQIVGRRGRETVDPMDILEAREHVIACRRLGRNSVVPSPAAIALFMRTEP
jgi:hypothetical protein